MPPTAMDPSPETWTSSVSARLSQLHGLLDRNHNLTSGDGNGTRNAEWRRSDALDVFTVGHFNNPEFSDLKIVCNGLEIHAHRFIVCAQSDFFAAALRADMIVRINERHLPQLQAVNHTHHPPQHHLPTGHPRKPPNNSQEKSTGRIAFPEDDSPDIYSLLEYLYKGSYTFPSPVSTSASPPSPTRTTTPPTPDSAPHPSQLALKAARLYALSVKYRVPPLAAHTTAIVRGQLARMGHVLRAAYADLDDAAGSRSSDEWQDEDDGGDAGDGVSCDCPGCASPLYERRSGRGLVPAPAKRAYRHEQAKTPVDALNLSPLTLAIYTSTPGHARGLRDLLVSFLRGHMRRVLALHPRFRGVLRECGDVCFDLAVAEGGWDDEARHDRGDLGGSGVLLGDGKKKRGGSSTPREGGRGQGVWDSGVGLGASGHSRVRNRNVLGAWGGGDPRAGEAGR